MSKWPPGRYVGPRASLTYFMSIMSGNMSSPTAVSLSSAWMKVVSSESARSMGMKNSLTARCQSRTWKMPGSWKRFRNSCSAVSSIHSWPWLLMMICLR